MPRGSWRSAARTRPAPCSRWFVSAYRSSPLPAIQTRSAGVVIRADPDLSNHSHTVLWCGLNERPYLWRAVSLLWCGAARLRGSAQDERPCIGRGLLLLWCGAARLRGSAQDERPCVWRGALLLWCGAARLRGSAPGPRFGSGAPTLGLTGGVRPGLRHSEFRLLGTTNPSH